MAWIVHRTGRGGRVDGGRCRPHPYGFRGASTLVAMAVLGILTVLGGDARAQSRERSVPSTESPTLDTSARWIGTLNAPNAWRVLDLRWPENAANPAGTAELRIGDASRRLAANVSRFDFEGTHILVEAEWARTVLHLDGELDGRVLAGTARITYNDSVLTEGSWRLERYEAAGTAPAEIVEKMRRAVGDLPATFTLGDAKAPPASGDSGAATESPVSAASEATAPEVVRQFGANGEVSIRSGGTPSLAFIGERVWQVRPPAGRYTPDTRMAEKLLLPEWVRGMEVLRHPERFEMEAWREDATHVSLHFWTRSGGVVPVRMTIDEETWLPVYASVEWDAGPRTIYLSEYETGPAGRHAGMVVESYRGRESTWRLVEVKEGTEADAFAHPSELWTTEFDGAANPELRGVTGAGEGGHLFVRPSVDGQDVGWFHTDTGAPFVMLDTKVCDQLGLPVLQDLGDGTLRKVEELSVGQIVLRNLLVFARDLSGMSAPEGSVRAGVLGGPVFAAAVTEFDYSAPALRVYDPSRYTTDRQWRSMIVERVPMVTASFPGGEGRFFIDTGKSSAVSFFSETGRAFSLLEGREVDEVANLTVTGETIELSTTLEWFELGGRRFENPQVQVKLPGTTNDDVTGALGFVGRGLFADRIVVFDYTGGRIAFAER